MTELYKLNLMKKFKELNVAEYTTKYGDYYGLMFAGADIATKELQGELEKENAELKEQFSNAKEIIEGLMRFCRCFAQHHTEDIRYKEAEEFLKCK